MNSKEKAKQLVDRFAQIPEEGSLMWYLSFEIAKKCALISVDEILHALEYKSTHNHEELCFYEEVKQEIEKL